MSSLQLNSGASQPYAKLLEEANQLTSHIENHGIPGIQRNAEQIHELSRTLASKAGDVAVSDRDKSRAAILFAARGFDAERLSRNLNAVDVKTTYEHHDNLPETDIVGYLSQQHEMIILTALSETQQTAISDFKKTYVRCMEQEWEDAKQELLDALGQRSSEWSRDFHVPTSASVPTQQSYGHGPSFYRRSDMNAIMIEYARVVYQANEYRVPKDPFPIVTTFEAVAHQLEQGHQNKKERVEDCWKAVAMIVHEDNVQDGQFKREVLQENCYGEMPADEKQRLLLQGARAFLEEQYDKHITRVVRQHPEKAQLGPKPGLVYRVRAFLNVKYLQGNRWGSDFPDIVDGFPVWPQIYYCLRCGDPEAALMVAESCAGVLDRFVFYLREYVADKSNMLPLQLWNQLLNDYRNLSRGHCDPYKLLVYNVIGRCEVNSQSPEILTTTQDFLWMKLSLITDPEVSRTLPGTFGHIYTLNQLQELLTKFGPGHFNPGGRNPLHYFQVLLLSQQFEAAVHFLSSVEQYRVDAIHFALALSYYGVLRVPVSSQAELLGTNEQGETTLNVAKLIRQYVRLFAKTDPREALQYLYFIPDPATRLESIKNLVLETREFELFFGGITEDGSRKPGCMAKFLGGNPDSPHILEIVKLAASDCERNGLYADAITLYELSRDYDRVLVILSKQLSQVVAVSGTSHERRRFLELARKIDAKYNDSVFRHMRDARLVGIVTTFKLVMNLVTFFDLYHAGRYEDALTHMESLGLLPLRHDDVMEQKVEAFKLLEEPIRRNFADILLTTMTLLYKIYTALKARPGSDTASHQYISSLRAKSRALITFVGMIQYHMPGDTNARLIRMDVFMN